MVWTADCKGQFRTGDGLYGYPLTVAEAYSRFLVSGAARLSPKPGEARPSFARLLQAYGLPEALRTDHGPPFATPAVCGLSKLSVWWSKRGIRHQRMAPGRPEPNGAHERKPPDRRSASRALNRHALIAAVRRTTKSARLRHWTPAPRLRSTDLPRARCRRSSPRRLIRGITSCVA